MTVFSALYAVHVLAALLWVGGMFFAWMILRPAAVARLPAPERLTLWLEVLQRFFLWVWIAVLALPVSGMGMLHLRFAGFETAPRYVQRSALTLLRDRGHRVSWRGWAPSGATRV